MRRTTNRFGAEIIECEAVYHIAAADFPGLERLAALRGDGDPERYLAALLSLKVQEEIKELQHVEAEAGLQRDVLAQMEQDGLETTDLLTVLEASLENFRAGRIAAREFFANTGIRDGRSDLMR